jgi:glycosyltransferase involved in cell wall biosynthesis
MEPSLKIIHIYLGDHCWEKTSSKGIYHFSQNWVREFLKQDLTGIEVWISVLKSDISRLIPDVLPEGIHIKPLSGHRIWLDQVWAPWFNYRKKIDLAFYSKGFIPFLSWGKEKKLTVAYDGILEFYREHYPDFFPRLKVRYFLKAKAHSLKKADALFTISEFSKQVLIRQYQPRCPLTVLPLGNSLPVKEYQTATRRGFLVFLSDFPHKASEETLRLLVAWKKRSQSDEPVYGVGRGKVPGGLEEEVICQAGLSDEALAERMGSVRVVILLSEIEGFGLPILEAYSLGAAVLYRDAHAFAEVLKGEDRGRWDGNSPESFFLALDRVLEMKENEIKEINGQLEARYTWRNCIFVSMGTILPLLESL